MHGEHLIIIEFANVKMKLLRISSSKCLMGLSHVHNVHLFLVMSFRQIGYQGCQKVAEVISDPVAFLFDVDFHLGDAIELRCCKNRGSIYVLEEF